MALAAATIIKAAQELVPCFSAKVIGPSVELRLLSDVQRDLCLEVLQRNASYLDSSVDVTTLTPKVALTLPAHSHLLDVTAVGTDGSQLPVDILNSDSRGVVSSPRLSCYELNQSLYLNGEVADFTGITKLVVRYGASPADLALSTDALLLPETARPALTARLAIAYLDRMVASGSVSDADVGALYARLGARESQSTSNYLASVALLGVPRTMPTVEVW